MSETADKAAEKLLESITKSQGAGAASTTKAPVSRKRTTSATQTNQNSADKMDSNTTNYEMRSQFVGNLRWPD